MNVFCRENLSAGRVLVLGGVLELFCSLGEVQQEPETAHGAVEQMQQVLDMLKSAKKPVVYAGGGCLDAAPELKEFIERTGIPITNTLMGLGCYPASDELSLDMLGMHGAVYANYAIDSSDLLLAFGVRFDDRVTGKLEAFASRASIVHIDIDPAEIGKNKHAHAAIFSNIKPALRTLNGLIRADGATFDFSDWVADIGAQREKFPFAYADTSDSVSYTHLTLPTKA